MKKMLLLLCSFITLLNLVSCTTSEEKIISETNSENIATGSADNYVKEATVSLTEKEDAATSEPENISAESVDDSAKEDVKEDTVSLTEKEDAVVSESETLSAALQMEGISYIVTNGSTGEQVRLETPSDVNKIKSLLNDVSILSQDDELSVGYLYAVRAEDKDGNLSDAICVYKGRVQIGGKVGYSVKNDEQLRDYLQNLF
ncbi:MAG: hypothetical protein ACI3W5_07970 [Faecousia sp.]